MGIAGLFFIHRTVSTTVLRMEYVALQNKNKERVMALCKIHQQETLMWEKGYRKEKAVSVKKKKEENKKKDVNICQ